MQDLYTQEVEKNRQPSTGAVPELEMTILLTLLNKKEMTRSELCWTAASIKGDGNQMAMGRFIDHMEGIKLVLKYGYEYHITPRGARKLLDMRTLFKKILDPS